MDKEDVVCVYIYIHTHIHIYIHNRILLSHKGDEIMSFAVAWMDLEIVILNEVSQTRQISYDTTYM